MTALVLFTVSTFTIFNSTAFAGDPVAGKDKAALCGGCHGMDGISVSPEIPNLRGQKEAYILKQIGDFKSGLRKNPIMSSMAAGLSDDDAADIAAFFSSLK
jgi:cytochrome c553